MKKVLFSLSALALIVSVPSFAKEKKVTTTTTTIRSTDGESSGPSSAWLGLSTDTVATVVGPGLSALFSFNDKLSLQTYLAVAGSSPFILGGGGYLKFNALGDAHKGLHIGGGFGLGNPASTFGVNIFGGLGLHFTVLDTIMVIADGSAGVHIGGGTNFTVGANGPHLGLGLLYRL